ncbi:TetR/AcrR family transcriptional regulator [Mycobacterium nebraskense]|uniref:TetR/AcrR family transcriptional regulator n=1 Tax=Mycobacterium nebraskense TaxID=244292 RepID=UPI0023F0DEBD|nr:TetR/AcrR family transcriptional regulator [Mycobacterium nebraskense]MBI2695743.1 TetR/AcrR family transcriptional regulator [Mycobacterium nebraskense]
MAVPKVSLEALVDAAADIADADGIDAVTMRRLAERCGVGVMTIYGYIRTKEQLLAVLADRYLAEIDMPSPDMAWQDQLVTLFRSVREVMLKHPTLVPIIANQRLDTTAAYRGAEVVCAALRAAGMPDRDVITSFATVTSFTVGSVQRELAAMDSATRPGLAALPAAEFPNVFSLFGPLVTGDAGQHFYDGLQMVIDAIDTRVPKRRKSRQSNH